MNEMSSPQTTAKNAEGVKIAVRNLNFFYGSAKPSLKNINLSLRTNEVTAFIGPSGCGKSTLLRVLNRMYELYPNQRAEGEVLLDGENILAPGLDLNLLLVFDALYRHRSVVAAAHELADAAEAAIRLSIGAADVTVHVEPT